jgi:hypothetical protein
MANEGNNRNLGVYFNQVPATGPDTDSIEIRLESQGTDVTPDLRMRHTRMIFKVGSIAILANNTPLEITFNSPINWQDNSLHTLLLDNSSGTAPAEFAFSRDYTFLDNNPLNSKTVSVNVGQRGWFYMSIISGKIYAKIMKNSDVISYK